MNGEAKTAKSRTAERETGEPNGQVRTVPGGWQRAQGIPALQCLQKGPNKASIVPRIDERGLRSIIGGISGYPRSLLAETSITGI
jgi:hypothetical protein